MDAKNEMELKSVCDFYEICANGLKNGCKSEI